MSVRCGALPTSPPPTASGPGHHQHQLQGRGRRDCHLHDPRPRRPAPADTAVMISDLTRKLQQPGQEHSPAPGAATHKRRMGNLYGRTPIPPSLRHQVVRSFVAGISRNPRLTRTRPSASSTVLLQPTSVRRASGCRRGHVRSLSSGLPPCGGAPIGGTSCRTWLRGGARTVGSLDRH